MKTGCILVLYNPEEDILQKSLDSIIPQVDSVYLADNSVNGFSPQNILSSHGDKIIYMSMNGNIGIAAAQNRGLEYYIDKGYDFIIFMDQDSIAPQGMLAQLHADYESLASEGVNVGAVGPRAVNRQLDKPYVGMIKKGVKYSDSLTEVSELISSASLIKIDTFKEVGLMDASLFIDGVDHEWCWRAHAKSGYRFFISEKARLSHQLGQGDRSFLGFKVAISTPFRIYFQYRNYLWLARRSYVPFYWKFINGVKYMMKYVYYPLFVSPRGQYFKQINRGIKDGFSGK